MSRHTVEEEACHTAHRPSDTSRTIDLASFDPSTLAPPRARSPSLETRLERAPPPPATPVRSQPEPPPPASGFLPAEQWASIQSFHAAMDHVKMETCSRCHVRWFSMDLKNDICHACFLRDQGGKTPFLMSAENAMDPGEMPAHLPTLTQIEEMIVARSHVQMMVYRYRGRQYHCSGHCQFHAKHDEDDIVVLRPSDRVVENDLRYRRQFRSDFRARKGHVMTWLRFLQAHHPDYRYVTISPDRIDALPIDDDISSPFLALIDDTSMEEEPPALEQPVSAELPPPDSQSMVPNLNITTTEVDLIVREMASRNSPPPGLPAPSIGQTPIDEASGKRSDLCHGLPDIVSDGPGRFQHPPDAKGEFNRLRAISDVLSRRQANGAARFYVSKASGLKDLSREELTEALLADEALLPQIVRQGSDLTGTRPFWRSKSNHLQAQACFLSPGTSPVFVTLSAADMQWRDLVSSPARICDHRP
ncbi:uncharacterized protein Z518_00436 [Rhinocladiella mackenziei CBS 650.93]|uniref:DUF6570 domain-containing protein n=1 Tax=Rhinocladiella mackenziei CBS 650.93 TaxID=1442369 RepID=A0A0D2G3Y8_9EURO|nr:uncharacterized protein Z518_00436 [Rhinocladiella mackenziei CBS 650.93]KIX09357.1 hypothetical protein Z518_00436 [Rhinocladiella mackenziei CBS 650.93]